MKKTKLNRFIQKYSLGGNVSSVKWKSNGDSLSTSFITPDKSLLGTVKADKVSFEDSEMGIYQTEQLQKLLSVLGEDVDMNITRVGDKCIALNVKNGSVSIDYNLSDLSVIPDPPALKKLPVFGTTIKIDADFINSFIKGKSALNDVDSFTVINEDGNIKFVIGYANTNTNRVNIPVKSEKNDINDPIYFNANLFKEVLVSNKECTSALLEISTEGLARIKFNVDDYTSTYYLVAMQDIN